MIEVEGLRFRYPGAAEDTLFGFDFHIDDGEIFGFLGPSGAGKSTTQNLLIGLLHGYSGSARVMGREIREQGSAYYEDIGVSFEVPNHFSKLTGRENLDYFRALYSAATEEPAELLEQVGLAAAANTPVAQYSKGMKNRLTFARSLLNRPRLLFLDEPTSGLDPATARKIKALIRQQQERGTTVFLTTHNMVDADELCDRVAFIVEGDLRAMDAPTTLKQRYGRRSLRVEVEATEISADSRAESHGSSKGRVESHDFALDDLGDNDDFLDLIRRHKVRTMHSQEPTLEQIFLEVTGRSLS